jgi:hypothetical protein
VKHRSAAWALCLVLAACGYGAPDEVLNGQAVAAVQRTGTNWSAYTTFTVPSTMTVHNGTTGTDVPTQEATPAYLISEIQTIMTGRGYTYKAWNGSGSATGADLVIGPTVYKGSAVYGGYYCDWYYYGYYPGYCGYTYYGSYNYGTLILSMADTITQPPVSGQPSASNVWTSAMYGILSSQPYNQTIVTTSVQRAFDQSPYIKK